MSSPAPLLAQFARQVAATPDAIALVETRQGKQYRFWEFAQMAERCAGYLQTYGLPTGAPVLVMQPLSVELYVILAALFQVGAIAVVWQPRQGRLCLQAIHPQAWIGWSPLWWRYGAAPVLRQIPLKIAIGCWVPGTVPWARVMQAPPHPATPMNAQPTTAILSFTSGTTGQPQPIRRSHALLWAQYQALQPILRWQPGTQELTTLPLFGLAHLLAGGTVVLPPIAHPRGGSGWQLLATMRDRAIERLVAAPGILRQLIHAAQTSPHPLPSLRYIFVGGAPMASRALAQLQAIAPQAQIHIVYGATEAEPIAAHLYQPSDRAQILAGAGLPAGRPVATLDCQIWQAGRELPMGSIGEIIVRGAHVARSPHLEQQLHLHGEFWHRTGDAGYFDAEGKLWLMGRWSARLVDERGVLYPFTVEGIANECPGVARSALVQWRGERWLLVEPERRAAIAPMRQLLQTQLAWAQLDRVILPFPIPVDRRHHAKVNYPQLSRCLRRRFPH